jgi:hypothetical protein
MLLRLAQPVQISNMPVLTLSDNLADIADNTPLTVIGLGTTNNFGATPNQLMEVVVQANSDAECVNAYGTGFDGVDVNSMFCASVPGGGKDSCSGDSGGPIVRVVGNEHRQVGIVSWGVECANADYPGVYSKIAGTTGLSWIKSVVCDQWKESSSICGNATPPTTPPAPSPTPPAPTNSPTPPLTAPPAPSPTRSPVAPPTSAPVGSGSCAAGQVFVEFSIDLDDFPDETSFEIYTSEGSVLMKGGPYPLNKSYKTVSSSKCLPDTCLGLTIRDSYGDGLFGSYSLMVNGVPQVDGDGDFEDTVNHFFNCDQGQKGVCMPLTLDITTDYYPEETSFYLIDMTTQQFIWAEDQFFTPNKASKFNECLNPDHCYYLEIFDDYGDGIDNPVKITYDGSLVFSGGPNIGYGEVFRFGC